MGEEIRKEETFEEQPKAKKSAGLRDPEVRGKLYKILFVLLLLGLAIFTVLRLWDDSNFVDTFYEIDDNRIDGPIRIVQLSDLHLNEFGPNNRDLVNEIIRLKPDLIAMTGDMVDMDATDYSVVIDCADSLSVLLRFTSATVTMKRKSSGSTRQVPSTKTSRNWVFMFFTTVMKQ